MKNEESLSRFLTQMGVGGSYESSGTFTILEENALEKLSRFTLGEKEEWLLKVVQAAVVAGSRMLDIKLLRSTVEVRFDFAGELECQDIANTVTDLSNQPGAFAAHFNIALRTLFPHHRFRLFSGTNRDLFWDGQRLYRGVDAEGLVDRLTLVVERRHLQGKSSWFDSAATRDALNYEQVLKVKACYAPLTLLLDGGEISPLTVPAPLRTPGQARTNLTSVLLVRRDEEKTSALSGSTCLSDGLRADKPLLEVGQPWSGESGNFYEMLWSAEDGACGPLYLLMLHHGVVCEEVELSAPACSVFVATFDGLPTDLSGLRLKWGTDDLKPALSELFNVKRGHELLDDVLSNYEPNIHISSRTIGQATKKFFQVGTLGGLFGLVSSFSLLGGGAGFVFGALSGISEAILHRAEDIADLRALAWSQHRALGGTVSDLLKSVRTR